MKKHREIGKFRSPMRAWTFPRGGAGDFGKGVYWRALFLVLCACVPPTLPERPPDDDELQLHFFAIGQGNACLLRRGDVSFLIDTGPGESGVGDSLLRMGVHSLQWVLISHFHEDHAGGFLTLPSQIRVESLLVGRDSGGVWLRDSLLAVARRRGVVVSTLQRGDTLPHLHPWRGRVLWPPAAEKYGGNPASLVVLVQRGNHGMLFPADIGFEEEAALRALEPTLRASWMVTPHHGSATSASLLFIGSLGLEFAVVSSGSNPWGHPRLEHLARLYWVLPDSSALWRTHTQGSLRAHWRDPFGLRALP